MTGKTLFIVNPVSGKPSHRKGINDFHASITTNPDYHLVETAYRGHATKLALEAINIYQTVVAVGGDGTINEVVTGIIDANIDLGIIPMGTGNGLAHHLNIPIDWPHALELLANGLCKPVDIIMVNDRIVVNVGGIGFDGHVAKMFNNTRASGLFSYMSLIIRELYSYKEFSFEIKSDEINENGKAFIIAIANGSEFGNRFKIAANAQLDDGKLNLVVIKKPAFLKLIWLLAKGYQGKLKPSKYYHNYLLENVELGFNDTIAHIDGELDEDNLTSPLQISIKKAALKIYC